jgi:hypothetical protein
VATGPRTVPRHPYDARAARPRAPARPREARLTVRAGQAALLGATLAAALAAVATGVRGALAVAIAALVANAWLAVSLAALQSDRRALARELIIAGRGNLPLAAVARERRRLLAPEHRAALATSLHKLVHDARHPTLRAPGSGPLYRPRVLAAAAAEAHAVADRLERDPAALAGIAVTERLLTAHDSPLYERDTDRLRQELRRISFALELRDEPSAPTT